MTTKLCKHCRKEIDSKANKCPHCQSDLRNWFVRHPILTVILVLFVFGIFGSTGNKKGNTNTSTNSSSNSMFGQKEPSPTNDPNPHFSDGTYQVGKEIQPGTYRTRSNSSGCYYERMAGFTGELGDILANGNTSAPEVVTILETDKGFKSTRCGVWTQDLSAITKSKTEFSDGTYIVGTDIEAGTYKSSGGSSCYYQRMSGFTHGGVSEILSNENTNTSAVVTIMATDKGFSSTRCGIWTKVE